MNAMLMRTTGSVHSVMGGSFDSSKESSVYVVLRLVLADILI